MVKYENGKYVPCTYKVTLKNRGKEETHYANFRTYWEDMVAKHDHLTNLNFEEIVFTPEQDGRLQEIAELNIPQGFTAEVRKYVKTGEFPDGYSHPLSDLKQKKEKEKYDNDLDDAYQMILENGGLI
ncbi:MAG: hypothetical protein ACQEQD_04455 [Bacillota bacterium]